MSLITSNIAEASDWLGRTKARAKQYSNKVNDENRNNTSDDKEGNKTAIFSYGEYHERTLNDSSIGVHQLNHSNNSNNNRYHPPFRVYVADSSLTRGANRSTITSSQDRNIPIYASIDRTGYHVRSSSARDSFLGSAHPLAGSALIPPPISTTDERIKMQASTTVVIIASLFFCLTLFTTIALGIFCRKRNTVFVFQKSEQEDYDEGDDDDELSEWDANDDDGVQLTTDYDDDADDDGVYDNESDRDFFDDCFETEFKDKFDEILTDDMEESILQNTTILYRSDATAVPCRRPPSQRRRRQCPSRRDQPALPSVDESPEPHPNTEDPNNIQPTFPANENREKTEQRRRVAGILSTRAAQVGADSRRWSKKSKICNSEINHNNAVSGTDGRNTDACEKEKEGKRKMRIHCKDATGGDKLVEVVVIADSAGACEGACANQLKPSSSPESHENCAGVNDCNHVDGPNHRTRRICAHYRHQCNDGVGTSPSRNNNNNEEEDYDLHSRCSGRNNYNRNDDGLHCESDNVLTHERDNSSSCEQPGIVNSEVGGEEGQKSSGIDMAGGGHAERYDSGSCGVSGVTKMTIKPAPEVHVDSGMENGEEKVKCSIRSRALGDKVYVKPTNPSPRSGLKSLWLALLDD